MHMMAMFCSIELVSPRIISVIKLFHSSITLFICLTYILACIFKPSIFTFNIPSE